MAEDEDLPEEELEDLEELMDDIEIDDEIHTEDKVRKKNAKVLLISIIGLLTIAGVYFGVNYYNIFIEEEEILTGQTGVPPTNTSAIKPLPPQEGIKKTDKKETQTPQKVAKKESSPPKKEVKKKEKAKKAEIKEKTASVKPESVKKTIKKAEKITPSKKPVKEKKTKSPPPSKTSKKQTVKKESTTPPSALKKKAKTAVTEIYKTGNYYIQLGLFVVKKNADNLTRSLKGKGFSPFNDPVKEMVRMYRVYAGNFSERARARDAISDLKSAGITTTLKKVSYDLYTLKVGSFYVKENAENLKREIAELGFAPKIVRVPILMDVHKVYIGYFKTKSEAASYQKELDREGFSKTLVLGG